MCTGTCDMAVTMWIVKRIGNTVQRDSKHYKKSVLRVEIL